MIQEGNSFKHSYENAIGRWAAVGPYYAMFPLEFAFEIVNQYSVEGDSVIDPFAGRASSVYAASALDRTGLGIEINPVGWLYGKVKLNAASQGEVEQRLAFIAERAHYFGKRSANKLPEFFHWCYSKQVLSFLLATKAYLDWRHNEVDATLMALILVYLHAKLGSGLSNQMRQSKAMAPDYSVKWWKERDKTPPDIDPYAFMQERIKWRYAKGTPPNNNSEVLLGDSVQVLDRIVQEVQLGTRKLYTLLFTSPPYHDITHYHYDQWLRLWMLGGPEKPVKTENKYKGRFSSKELYRKLLISVFQKSAQIMSQTGTVYIRTDARQFTLNTTKEVLQECFPGWRQEMIDRPVNSATQTSLFGDKTPKPGEVDIILTHA